MIKKINIENFKCYQKNSFETSKITLITGANSSGKSSLLYSILSTVQSGEFPFQFSPNGKYVRMGDFEEIVFKHDKNNIIKIEFELEKQNEKVATFWKIDSIRNLPELQKLVATSSYYKLIIEKFRKYNLDFEYYVENDENQNLRSPEFIKKIFEIINIESVLKDEDKKGFDRIKSKINFKFNNFDELQNFLVKGENYYLFSIIGSIKKIFTNYDDNINFISSFRLFPERTYYETSKNDLKVGKFGENYEDQIIFWESTKAPEYKELVQILRELGLLEEIKSKRLDGGRFEILIKSKPNGIWSSLSDVGFGISQFLPIIVADLQLSKNSILFIAQPEIHLHPKIQAQFGDYIINRISKGSKKYVIETHSEYLINRIRLALAKKIIKVNDVKTYYIENNGFKAKQYNLQLLYNGQIKNAPNSFFDTYMLDVMNIAIEAE